MKFDLPPGVSISDVCELTAIPYLETWRACRGNGADLTPEQRSRLEAVLAQLRDERESAGAE
jgi:hypothetical protein